MDNQNKLRIGTRSSKLALFQTNQVAALLKQAHPLLEIELVKITTSGDWRPEHGERPLSTIKGGKALFAKEIECAILEGHVDCGVHSMKDMESFVPDGLCVDHVLARVDARDALLSNHGNSLDDLPQGAVVGTVSTRRAAFLLNARPDLKIVPLRGNVPTRIEKLRSGQVDATILAVAGLERLGLQNEIQLILDEAIMLPSAGQGIITIETRADDERTHEICNSIHDHRTGLCVAAERAALQYLDGSCQTPIGSHATLQGDVMHFNLAVASIDGAVIEKEYATANVKTIDQARKLGAGTASLIKKRVPQKWLEKKTG